MAHTGPDPPSGISGAWQVARTVTRSDGIRGLYKGFGTVIAGMIPGRMLYMTGLESAKAGSSAVLNKFNLSDTATAGAANFVAGAFGSLSSQLVVVPIDVISQRLMIQDNPRNPNLIKSSASSSSSSSSSMKLNGFQMAKGIISKEGVGGLYRGFGASIATFVPSSALWWASYGAWQSILWHQVDRWQNNGTYTDNYINDNSRNSRSIDNSLTDTMSMMKMNQNKKNDSKDGVDNSNHQQQYRSDCQLLMVQIAAGILTGCTTGAITTPLDTIKVRMQTMRTKKGGGEGSGRGRGVVTFRSVASELLKEQGVPAFFRGAFPRMTSMSVWGTAMVSAYEFLKRLCQK